MGRTSVTTTLIVTCVLLLAAAAAAQEVEEKPLKFEQVMTSDGDALFAELCAVCHGTTGKGDGPAVQALAIAVPDLTMLAAGNGGSYPAQRVEKVITGEKETAAHGSRDMPMWGPAFSEVRPAWGQARGKKFAQLRIRNLVEYIGTLQVVPEKN